MLEQALHEENRPPSLIADPSFVLLDYARTVPECPPVEFCLQPADNP